MGTEFGRLYCGIKLEIDGKKVFKEVSLLMSVPSFSVCLRLRKCSSTSVQEILLLSSWYLWYFPHDDVRN